MKRNSFFLIIKHPENKISHSGCCACPVVYNIDNYIVTFTRQLSLCILVWTWLWFMGLNSETQVLKTHHFTMEMMKNRPLMGLKTLVPFGRKDMVSPVFCSILISLFIWESPLCCATVACGVEGKGSFITTISLVHQGVFILSLNLQRFRSSRTHDQKLNIPFSDVYSI